MPHPPYHDAFAVASIVLAAATYLFDFGSNIVVLVEYYTLFRDYFYGLLGILVCCHSLNVLLFKLKFTHRETPLFAAYFLPLIHLYRLAHLLWRTLSCKGIQDIRSSEMNGLYSILGSAMEGVPMLMLQLCGYLVLTEKGVLQHSMPTTFKVSIAAAFLSAAYNGGTSVQSIAKNALTLKQKLGAGMIGAGFTFSATVLRCLTFTYIIVYIVEYFAQKVAPREQAKFHVYNAIPMVVVAGFVLAYSLYFWLLYSPRNFLKSLRNPRCLLTALAFGYMSMYMGPLYPLISQANDADQLGSYIFHIKLLTLSLLHLLLDLTILCVTYILGTLPQPCLIVSSLIPVGYMVFLFAYMKFDTSCGPTMTSSASVVPALRDASNANDHQLVLLSELCMLPNAQSWEPKKWEAEGISEEVNPSCQKTNLARSEKIEGMGWPPRGLFSSEMQVAAQAHILPEACIDSRPLLICARAVDGIAESREGSSCVPACCPSSNRPLRTYSERKAPSFQTRFNSL